MTFALRIAPPASVLLWLACVCLCAGPGRARAQPIGDVVVVPFGVPDSSAALSAASMLEAELSDGRFSPISLHDGRDRFTARSRPPQLPSDSDLDVLARAAREAIEHVAFGRAAAAQKSVREVISRAERTLESLNRETATARQILDTCLTLVRSTLQTGRRDIALEQATRCRRLVPDLAPSEAAHPANVVGVLAEADNLLRRMRIGKLTVQSAPESNCSVYLNGRHLGTTPFRLDRAAAGEYRVQVECGRTIARVHVVQLGDEAVNMLVDTEFDRAVASDPRLLLRYEKRRDARAQAVAHAIQLGRELGADDVVLVGIEGERAELLRVQVRQQRLVGRTSLPWSERHGFARPALDSAIAALAEARIEGEPSLDQRREPPAEAKAEPKPEPASEPAAAAPAASSPASPAQPVSAAAEPPAAPNARAAEIDARTRRIRRAGFGLLGVATAVVAVGIGFEWRRQRLHDKLAALDLATDISTEGRFPGLQADYERAGNWRWVGVAGPALGTVAAGLSVKPREVVPWWGYTLGGLGLGLMAAGGVEVALHDRCLLSDETRCRRERDSHVRGALFVAAGVPLLSVPLFQVAKRSRERGVALVPELWRGNLQLRVRARF